MTLRTKRVAGLYRDILSDVLRKKVSDPRIDMVSIIRVEITKDLKQAHVYFSLLSDDPEVEKKTLDGLKSATTYIEKQVGKELTTKFLPRIEWHLSRGISYSIHVQSVIDDIHSREGSTDK